MGGAEGLLVGLTASLEPTNFLLIVIGTTVGLLFGAVPGLQNVTALSLLLPFTYAMIPSHAFLLMTSIYAAGVFGGSITAILYRIPGAPENAATTFDGFPLAQQGRASEALATAILCSAVGGLFGALMLVWIAPEVAPIALKFGPPEYFALVTFALCFVSMTGYSYLKTLISAFLGLLFATVGLDQISGQARFTFGNETLLGGFDFVVIIIGVFAISEVVNRSGRNEITQEMPEVIRRIRVRLPAWRNLVDLMPTVARSSILGTLIGTLPALGAAIAGFFSYEMERRISRTPEKFGTGELRGIAAPESANNASVGGALTPLVTLGIPGSSSTAVMLGAFLIYGLQPGAALFADSGSVVYMIFAALIISNALILIFGVLAVPLFSRLVGIPFAYMAPIIVILCTAGAYTVRYNIVDLWSMFAFGVVGFLLDRYKFSAPVFVLAFILGQLAEVALGRSLVMFDGDLTRFFTRPISGTLLGMTGLLLAWIVLRPFWVNYRRR